ncbi:MAG: AAA family ATPase [Planctomycetia bacterium]|nr:AAA family ATPase [Planctomycetia bacterium]
MIDRLLEQIIKDQMFTGKTIVLLGARQVGKTTLMRKLVEQYNDTFIWLNGDDIDVRESFRSVTSTKVKAQFGDKRLIVIDEAQRLENAGLTVKIMHDNLDDVQLLITGSSSFELTDKIKESMTGRKWEYRLFPMSIEEICDHTSWFDEKRLFEDRLIYGLYPEVVNLPEKRRDTLGVLANDYLYKDIFALKDVRKPDILEKLVKALALQIGNQVSYNELSNLIQADKETIERYVRLLEDAFIIFRLPSFRRNLRTELSRMRKIYFFDVGIRNAIINNFAPLELRNDKGALFENFLISERMKYNHYHKIYTNQYFWRTHSQQEIDYIEERDGEIYAYEFKWKEISKSRFPKTFVNTYNPKVTEVITPDNYMDFVGCGN